MKLAGVSATQVSRIPVLQVAKFAVVFQFQLVQFIAERICSFRFRDLRQTHPQQSDKALQFLPHSGDGNDAGTASSRNHNTVSHRVSISAGISEGLQPDGTGDLTPQIASRNRVMAPV
jgi:hypothetical protein